MELDDKALITRVLDNRDQRAFAELVKRYQSQIRYSQRQLTGWDEALADDLAQETFLSVYRNLSKFRGDAKFSTWLYRIAYNCFLQHKRASRIEEPLGDDDVTPDTGTTDSDIDMHRDLARALQTLPPAQRMAIHLYCHYEMSHSEIAEALDRLLGSVKSDIQRGRERLKAQLEAWAPEKT